MKEQSFQLSSEFIELNKLLKITRVAQTGGHAKLLIEDGMVQLNGQVEFRIRAKIRKNDIVEIDDTRIVVE
ncbi:MAG: RNA-binding S4 domain-containing protein [Bacteroidales bacterium]|nr:RNA-binding S4 domain-containing protein [Bacteroidales bacterium]